ncbi:MAG: hypothetical protein H8E74_10140 [Gammaproteobacteria bacterium]|nr:hypothetical protein [Gammaproteobacteria bacterium]
MFKRINNLFTEHPSSLNESYFEHFLCAFTYGIRIVFSGFACLIHSVFPFLFKTAASDLANEIVNDVTSRKKITLVQQETKVINQI